MQRRFAIGKVAAAFFAIGLLCLTGCSGKRDDERVLTVAAAADLRYAFADLIKKFEESHPDIKVEVTYGASGKFFTQLSNRAPFDVFLSADVGYPRRLIENGLAAKEDEFIYAVGHIVVWVPSGSPIDVQKLGKEALLHPSVQKIAIANPRVAPYGRAAEAALRRLKVYERVKDRLIQGESVAQAAQFVQSGAAQIGIIPLALARAPELKDGRFWEVPAAAYPRMEQGGIILSWAKDRQAAEALRAFLTGAEGRAILRRYGFSAPEK
jgi:molybdate transport system substrate-binding protein